MRMFTCALAKVSLDTNIRNRANIFKLWLYPWMDEEGMMVLTRTGHKVSSNLVNTCVFPAQLRVFHVINSLPGEWQHVNMSILTTWWELRSLWTYHNYFCKREGWLRTKAHEHMGQNDQDRQSFFGCDFACCLAKIMCLEPQIWQLNIYKFWY